MRRLKGIIISTKMNKSAVVAVTIKSLHPLYRKPVSSVKNYVVDMPNDVKAGDFVEIIETRPISKRKRWKILKERKKK